MRLTSAVAFFLMWIPPSFLSAFTVDDVVGNLERKEGIASTVRFDYTQNVTFIGSDMTAKSKGTAYVKRPNAWHVDQMAPVEQKMIMNKTKTWIYTPSNHQVVTTPIIDPKLMSRFSMGLLPLSSNALDLKKTCHLALVDKDVNDGVLILEATPKDPSMAFTIKLTLSTENWLPTESVYESESAKIVTTMTNYEVNPTLSDALFDFKPPKGTTVVAF